MGNLKPELSKKNDYWIPKERYYELLHFCRQYDDWKKELNSLYGSLGSTKTEICATDISEADPTCKKAAYALKLRNLIDMVKTSAFEADPEIAKYLILGVTKGYGYGWLSVKMGMPMGQDAYYERYRKFFYILSQKRH